MDNILWRSWAVGRRQRYSFPTECFIKRQNPFVLSFTTVSRCRRFHLPRSAAEPYARCNRQAIRRTKGRMVGGVRKHINLVIKTVMSDDTFHYTVEHLSWNAKTPPKVRFICKLTRHRTVFRKLFGCGGISIAIEIQQQCSWWQVDEGVRGYFSGESRATQHVMPWTMLKGRVERVSSVSCGAVALLHWFFSYDPSRWATTIENMVTQWTPTRWRILKQLLCKSTTYRQFENRQAMPCSASKLYTLSSMFCFRRKLELTVQWKLKNFAALIH